MALVGGLQGSEPAGAELLMRLARHLGAVLQTPSDDPLSQALQGLVVYIVPRVDEVGFDADAEGERVAGGEPGRQFY